MKRALREWLEYITENPAPVWRFAVAFLFLGFSIVHWTAPERAVPPLYMILAIPTFLLVFRCSEGQRKKRPLAPYALREVGVLCLQGTICTLLLHGIMIFGSMSSTSIPDPPHVDIIIIHVFGIALALSILFGCVAWPTRAARIGVGVLGGWVTLMIVWAITQAALDLAHG